MQFEQGNMKGYVVTRGFHLGEVTLNLSSGDKLKYDGATLDYRGKTYSAPSLQRAIQARLVALDDGHAEVEKKREEPVAKPKPRVIIEDQENLVVAKVRLPEETNSLRSARKSTEETARTTAQNTPRRVVMEDQRVVGQVKHRDPAKAVTKASSEAPKPKRDPTQELLRAEGVTPPGEKRGYEIIDASHQEGRIVGRVKSIEEREADLRANHEAGLRTRASQAASASSSDEMTPEERDAFNRDLEIAKAKREGRAPIKTAAKAAPKVEAEPSSKEAFPDGYPQYNRFPERLKWCKDRVENDSDVGVEDVKVIYRLSNDRFREFLKSEFPDIDFTS